MEKDNNSSHTYTQVNYLIDEAMNIGKGANCTISLLHHFLGHHNLGELNLVLHADNCSGQNKNRFVMQYLTWRVLTGLNERIEISFMLVGHTKFAPDWCFGLLKQKFRRTKVGCLADIAKVVNDSAECNHAEIVGSEDGTVLVPQYDWAAYFSGFFRRQAFKGIKSLHHLVFCRSIPGEAMVREMTDTPARKITLLSNANLQWAPSYTQLPPLIPPPGLSRERREYLFTKIREYCPPNCQDIVCPDPSPASSFLTTPLLTPPSSATATPPPHPTPATSLPTATCHKSPPAKRRCRASAEH